MPRMNRTAPFQPHNARCPECGCVFFKDEYWKRICFDCWKTNNRPEVRDSSHRPWLAAPTQVPGSRIGDLALEVARLTAELATAKSLLGEIRSDNQRLARMIVALEAQSKLEPEMLKRLIYLVHPDKHNNSDAAHLAFNYLRSLKRDTTQ